MRQFNARRSLSTGVTLALSAGAIGVCSLCACSSDVPHDSLPSGGSAGLSAAAAAGAPVSMAGAGGAGSPLNGGTGGALGPGGASGSGNSVAGAASQAGSASAGGNGAGGNGAGGNGAGGNGAGGNGAGGNGAGGNGAGGNGAGGNGAAGAPMLAICPGCRSIFDGNSLSGWVQIPANSWSVKDGALHSLGTARGVAYTSETFGDFRFIFQSRLVEDTAKHLPCVLFFGNALTKDALQAIQVQPPNGYMWDYRPTGPTANKSPDQFETRFGHPAVSDATWNQCEMLANLAAGTMRLACCQVTGTGPCKASEIVAFKDPTSGKQAPLALQVHNAGMVEEFKSLYVESPVAQPSTLLTTQ
jgi:Domain of Unknown Function (DUF1080)